jgi:hypothetical protein
MKQFLAFYGKDFYPLGGMADFLGDYDLLEDAIEAINKEASNDVNYTPEEIWEYAWAHIYDTTQREIIWKKS